MPGRGTRNGGTITGGKAGIAAVGWGTAWGTAGGNVCGTGWGTVCTGVAEGAEVETLTDGVATETPELGVWSCVVGADKKTQRTPCILDTTIYLLQTYWLSVSQ